MAKQSFRNFWISPSPLRFFKLISAHSHCSHTLGGPHLNLVSFTPMRNSCWLAQGPSQSTNCDLHRIELLLVPIWHWTEAWILKNCGRLLQCWVYLAENFMVTRNFKRQLFHTSSTSNYKHKNASPYRKVFFWMVTSLDCGNVTERNLAAIPGILFLFRELNIVKSFSPKLLSQNLYPATIVEHKIYHSFLFSRHACMLSGFSCAWLCATLWMVAHQAPLSKGFSRQEHWSGLQFPPPDFRALFYPPESLFCGCILSFFTWYGLKVSPSTWGLFYEYCLGCLNISVSVKIKSQCNFLSLM